MDGKVNVSTVYEILDLCKFASIDGERVSIVAKSVEDGKCILTIGLKNGFSRDRFSFSFPSAKDFNDVVLPNVLKRLFDGDSIVIWNWGLVDERTTTKSLIVTKSGNECVIHSMDRLYNQKLHDKVFPEKDNNINDLSSDVETSKVTENYCNDVLNYLKKRKISRDIVDFFTKDEINSALEFIDKSWGDSKSFSRKKFIEYANQNINDEKRKIVEFLLDDIINNRGLVLNKLKEVVRNDRNYEELLKNPEFSKRVEIGKVISQAGYFDARLTFPNGTKDFSKDGLDKISSTVKSKYNVLAYVKSKYESQGKKEEAAIVQEFIDYLVESKNKVESKKEISSNEKDVDINVLMQNFEHEVVNDDFDKLKESFLICNGGKIAREKVELIIKEEDDKVTVSVALTDSFSRDRFDFVFSDKNLFFEKQFGELYKLFEESCKISKKQKAHNDLQNVDLFLLTGDNGNEMLISRKGKINENTIFDDVKNDSKGKKLTLPVAPSKDREILDEENRILGQYFHLYNLLKSGKISEQELAKMDDLSKKSEKVAMLVEAYSRVGEGKLSFEEYTGIYDKFYNEYVESCKKSGIKGVLEEIKTPKVDNDDSIKINKSYTGGRFSEDKQLSDYFILREKENLSLNDIEFIKNLAESNDKVRALEEAREKLNKGVISKEEFDKIHDMYLNILRDSIRTKLGAPDTHVGNTQNATNNSSTESSGSVLSTGEEQLADYFRKETLREKGMLPLTGIEYIKTLAESSDKVRILEEAHDNLKNGLISKEEFDKIHDTYFNNLRDSVSKKLEATNNYVENTQDTTRSYTGGRFSEDKQLSDYFILREKGNLSLNDIEFIKNLAESNDKVRALEEAHEKLNKGVISKEEFDKIHDMYLNILRDSIRTKLGAPDTHVGNTQNATNNSSTESSGSVLSTGEEQLADYFRKETLREKGMLPLTGIEYIKTLAESNDKVRILEEAHENLEKGLISKEEFDKIHDMYFNNLRDSVSKKLEQKSDNTLSSNEVKVASFSSFTPIDNDEKDNLINNSQTSPIKAGDGDMSNGDSYDSKNEATKLAEFLEDYSKKIRQDAVLQARQLKESNDMAVLLENGARDEALKLAEKNAQIDISNSALEQAYSIQEQYDRESALEEAKVQAEYLVKQTDKSLSEITDAYEVASEYATKDNPTSLKIFFSTSNPDKAEVIISHGLVDSETVLYQKEMDCDELTNDYLPFLCKLYLDENSMGFNQTFTVPHTNRGGSITLGKNENVFQVSNAPISFVDKVQDELQKIYKNNDKVEKEYIKK